MKFTDGYWLLKRGVQAYHPAQAYEIETDPEFIDCPCHHPADRYTRRYAWGTHVEHPFFQPDGKRDPRPDAASQRRKTAPPGI